jgi:hypothetical protein
MLLLSGAELGEVITRLERSCPEVLEMNSSVRGKVEINLDGIPPKLLGHLCQFAAEKVSTRKKSIASEVIIDDISNKRKRKR